MAERTNKQADIDLLLFDLDGTLIDSVPQLHLAVDAALRACGLPGVSLEQVKQWIGNGADMLLRRAIVQSYDVQSYALNQAIDPALLVRVRVEFDAHYLAGLSRDFTLFPDVQVMLQRLRSAGYRMAVVTNKPHPFVTPLLDEAGLSSLFDCVLGGDVLPQRKPDPTPLLHVCEFLQVTPARSLMIGDSRNDVLAAKAAGIPVVGLTYGYNHGEPIAACEPDWVMDHFCQLGDLLLAH
jgi:phosphoglycolate phosphatase